MKLGSLFSGIGGIELGLEPFGMETVWQVEFDKHASSVLARHWPGVPNYGDITKVDWKSVEPVDVVCLGFPCQDLSYAGRGAGIKDGTRSGLWSYAADALSVLRPRAALIENVSALAVRGLDRVLCDLAEIGFDAEWCCVRAADVGAPHRRERLFILAVNTDFQPGEQRGKSTPGQAESGRARTLIAGSGGAPTTDTSSGSLQRLQERGELGSTAPAEQRQGLQRERAGNTVSDSGEAPTNPDCWRLEISSQRNSEPIGPGQPAPQRDDANGLGQVEWGDYEIAIRKWEALTRHAPPPTDEKGRLSVEFTGWLMGFDAGWTDGLPRSQALKCLGNAVVPQCAAVAWQLLTSRPQW